MELDIILANLQIVASFIGGGGILVAVIAGLKKIVFYTKVAKQAVASFEELREANLKIFNRIQADPERKELAKVLLGGIRKIEGLTGLTMIPGAKGFIPNMRNPPEPPAKRPNWASTGSPPGHQPPPVPKNSPRKMG